MPYMVVYKCMYKIFTKRRACFMAKVLKWTNHFSGEQGFVQSIVKAEGHFVNTYDVAEAKVFNRQCDITRALNVLALIGETADNDFEAVEI